MDQSTSSVRRLKMNDSVKHHLLNVYTSSALFMLCSSMGTIAFMLFQSQISAFAAGCLSVWLFKTFKSLACTQRNQNKRVATLLFLGFTGGLAIGSFAENTISLNSQFFVTVFLAITLIFLCFALSALYASEVGDIFLGGILSTAFTVMLLSFAVNFLFPNIFHFNLYAGAVLVCAYIFFNTRVAVKRYYEGEDDYLLHTIALVWKVCYGNRANTIKCSSHLDSMPNSVHRKSSRKYKI